MLAVSLDLLTGTRLAPFCLQDNRAGGQPDNYANTSRTPNKGHQSIQEALSEPEAACLRT